MNHKLVLWISSADVFDPSQRKASIQKRMFRMKGREFQKFRNTEYKLSKKLNALTRHKVQSRLEFSELLRCSASPAAKA